MEEAFLFLVLPNRGDATGFGRTLGERNRVDLLTAEEPGARRAAEVWEEGICQGAI